MDFSLETQIPFSAWIVHRNTSYIRSKFEFVIPDCNFHSRNELRIRETHAAAQFIFVTDETYTMKVHYVGKIENQTDA